MLPLLVSAALVLIADQTTKYYIRVMLPDGRSVTIVKGLLYITHVRNKGAVFGLFSGKQTLFIVATLLSICLIVFYYVKMRETLFVLNAALGLELGGAIGNLIDRLSRGWVTDFIHVRDFPVFNIADSAIVVGVVLLLFVSLLNIVKKG
jgi:signal peptidase II